MTSTEESKQSGLKKWIGPFGMFMSHLIAFCVLYLTLTHFVPSLKFHYATNGVTHTPFFNRIELVSDIFVHYSLVSMGLILANALIIVLVSNYMPRWISTYSHTVHSCLAVVLLLSFSWMLNPLFSNNLPNGTAEVPITTASIDKTTNSSK